MLKKVSRQRMGGTPDVEIFPSQLSGLMLHRHLPDLEIKKSLDQVVLDSVPTKGIVVV